MASSLSRAAAGTATGGRGARNGRIHQHQQQQQEELYDPERDYEDPMNPKAQRLERLMEQLNQHGKTAHDFGFAAQETSFIDVDNTDADLMKSSAAEVRDENDSRNVGVNIASARPVEEVQEVILSNPMVFSEEEAIFHNNKIEGNLHHHHKYSNKVLHAPKKDLVLNPEDVRTDPTESSIPDIDTVNQYE